MASPRSELRIRPLPSPLPLAFLQCTSQGVHVASLKSRRSHVRTRGRGLVFNSKPPPPLPPPPHTLLAYYPLRRCPWRTQEQRGLKMRKKETEKQRQTFNTLTSLPMTHNSLCHCLEKLRLVTGVRGV